MDTTTPKIRQYREQLERARHCINITVTQLTTVLALIPTDEEIDNAPRRRDPDDADLSRHVEELRDSLHELMKQARGFTDYARQCAGLDPQCCDWPSFEEIKQGSC